MSRDDLLYFGNFLAAMRFLSKRFGELDLSAFVLGHTIGTAVNILLVVYVHSLLGSVVRLLWINYNELITRID